MGKNLNLNANLNKRFARLLPTILGSFLLAHLAAAVQGELDRGDIAGLPGVMLECKDHGTISLSDIRKEVARQVDNDDAFLGLACIKQRGKSSPEDAYWLIDARHVPAVIRALSGLPAEEVAS